MTKFTLEHEINCSVEDFWKVFFDKSFNEKLFRDELGFPEYVILEQTDNDGKVTRRVRGRPKMEMPKAVMKLLGDSFGYEEEGELDPSSGVWSFKMTPNTMAAKLRNEGNVRAKAIGDDKCLRVTELLCEAKVFGVGGLIESSTEKEMRRGWDASAVYMNKWLKDNPPS